MKLSVKTKIKNFSRLWWEEFLKTTENLSKTSVFRNCMDKKETKLLRKYVLQILQSLAEMRTDKYGYRVYVEGKKLDKEEMNRIYDSSPYDDETLKQWSRRVSDEKKFGMIINSGEKFNRGLSKNIALKTEPFLHITGVPREGINFSIFIGNYDKTPLGIHKDPLGQDVIHFHLGPGDKTMYTWSKEDYEKLTTAKGYEKQDIEGLLPHATEFFFQEGDLYFMREGTYHIGKQNDLSIGLTFWRYNHTKGQLIRKLQNVILNEYMGDLQDDIIKSDNNSLDDNSGLDEIFQSFEYPTALSHMGYFDFFREIYNDLRYSLHSNAGYRTTPLFKEESVDLKIGDTIQIEKPFKILYKNSIDNQKLHVFIRGNKIELNDYPCIKALINRLNEGSPIKVSESLQLLDADWDISVGLQLLQVFYENHGIEKL